MEHERKGADLLYGVPAIAGFMGLTENVVYHLTRREDFPSFKIGGKVCIRASAIERWVLDQEAKARA